MASSSFPAAYFELLEACAFPGCPVCRLIHHSTWRYLDYLFQELVMNGETRQRLRNSLGFCHQHAWSLLDHRMGISLGIATIYQDILSKVLVGIPLEIFQPSPRARFLIRTARRVRDLRQKVESLLRVLAPREICPACELREKVTERALSALSISLKDERMLAALRSSDGLCLPHLRRAIGQIKDESDLAAFVSLSKEKMVALEAELVEFMRKTNYQFLTEEFGKEGDAWQRVTHFVVGDRFDNSQSFRS